MRQVLRMRMRVRPTAASARAANGLAAHPRAVSTFFGCPERRSQHWTTIEQSAQEPIDSLHRMQEWTMTLMRRAFFSYPRGTPALVGFSSDLQLVGLAPANLLDDPGHVGRNDDTDMMGDLTSLWDGILNMAVPKNRKTRSKKRIKSYRKRVVPDKRNILTCKKCGELKLMHHLCKGCLKAHKEEWPRERMVEEMEKEAVEMMKRTAQRKVEEEIASMKSTAKEE